MIVTPRTPVKPQFAFHSSKCLLYNDPPAVDLCILLIVCHDEFPIIMFWSKNEQKGLASARQCPPCRLYYLPGGPEKMSREQDKVKCFPFHVV